MFYRWRRVDSATSKVLKLFFIGSGVKVLGYVIVTAGIFMGIVDRSSGIRLIAIGISLVAFGWGIIYVAYRASKS